MKNIIQTCVFCAVIFIGCILHILIPDGEISVSERRTLETFPDFSVKDILSGKWEEDFETYALDNFPFRDGIRTVKAVCENYVFFKKDNNNIFISGDIAVKMLYPLNETSVKNITAKMNSIISQYLSESENIYYTVVPDKGYFLSEKTGHLSLDYDKLLSLMNESLSVGYIDIFPLLSEEDYYRTDTHWSQPEIISAAKKIAETLGVADCISWEFEEKTVGDFYGVLFGQAALPLKPDTMSYLTNETIENCTVYNAEKDSYGKVYDLGKLDEESSVDMYDIFLSGATPVLVIENTECATGKELIVFRDSFGSSLVPLLCEGYSVITVLDTRYISSALLGNYVDFHGQDVLFLYNIELINKSFALK